MNVINSRDEKGLKLFTYQWTALKHDSSVSLGGGSKSALPTVCLTPSRSSTPLNPSLSNTSTRKCLCSSRDQWFHSVIAPVNLGVRLTTLCCLLQCAVVRTIRDNT